MIAYHEGEVGYLCTDYNFDGSWSVYGNEKYEIEIFDSDTKKKTLVIISLFRGMMQELSRIGTRITPTEYSVSKE